MTDVRARIRERFLTALDEHIKALIDDRTGDHEMDYVGSTHFTGQELDSALSALLSFEPESE